MAVNFDQYQNKGYMRCIQPNGLAGPHKNEVQPKGGWIQENGLSRYATTSVNYFLGRVASLLRLQILPFCVAICGWWSSASGADQNLSSRFQKSLSDARAVSSVQIEWLDTYTLLDTMALKELKVPELSRTYRNSEIWNGRRYRVKRELVSGTQTNLMRLAECAYDGQLYASYLGEFHTMTESKVPPPGGSSESRHNPLVAPFMFLCKYSDACRSCVLRFSDVTLDGFADKVDLPPGKVVAGLCEISLAGPNLGKQPTVWTITMEEGGKEFTPTTTKYVVPGEKYQLVTTFLEYTNVGAYRFPSRSEWRMTAYPVTDPPKLLATGSDVVVAVSIPGNLDASVFQLTNEENTAEIIWDADQQRLTKMLPNLTCKKTVTNAMSLSPKLGPVPK